MTIARNTHGGASNPGSSVAETCAISHAPTRYSPAMRMTLRRRSSAKNEPAAIRPPAWMAKCPQLRELAQVLLGRTRRGRYNRTSLVAPEYRFRLMPDSGLLPPHQE